MTELQEQYRLLEVSADVSFATLKQAYKDLVLVWHPDRFSDHPRLQKKAEEKLKCINLAYQEISAVYREEKPVDESRQTQAASRPDPPPPRSKDPCHRGSRAQAHKSKAKTSKARYRTRTRNYRDHNSHPAQPHRSGISISQARFVIEHFHFRSVQRPSNKRLRFKSGPFNLEMNVVESWLSLTNLCDSINGFHPILLAIPCKSSRLFVGEEAQELIDLFQQTQHL